MGFPSEDRQVGQNRLARMGSSLPISLGFTNPPGPLSTHQLATMASTLPEDYPPDLSLEEEQYLLSNLKDWSIAHGLAVRPAPSFVQPAQDPSGVLATTAPVTLFPSLFPKSCFEEGLSIQKAYNKLYAAISRDEQWLKEIVQE